MARQREQREAAAHIMATDRATLNMSRNFRSAVFAIHDVSLCAILIIEHSELERPTAQCERLGA
jgi:hypothetical protein